MVLFLLVAVSPTAVVVLFLIAYHQPPGSPLRSLLFSEPEAAACPDCPACGRVHFGNVVRCEVCGTRLPTSAAASWGPGLREVEDYQPWRAADRGEAN